MKTGFYGFYRKTWETFLNLFYKEKQSIQLKGTQLQSKAN